MIIEKEVLWILIVSAAVLLMLVAVMLIDKMDEVRHQRQARKAFWDWICYTRRL